MMWTRCCSARSAGASAHQYRATCRAIPSPADTSTDPTPTPFAAGDRDRPAGRVCGECRACGKRHRARRDCGCPRRDQHISDAVSSSAPCSKRNSPVRSLPAACPDATLTSPLASAPAADTSDTLPLEEPPAAFAPLRDDGVASEAPSGACAGREHDRPTRVPRAARQRARPPSVRPRATPGGHDRPAVQSVTVALLQIHSSPRAPSAAGEGGAPTRTRCILGRSGIERHAAAITRRLAPADISTAPTSSAESPVRRVRAPEAPVPEPPLKR